MVLYVFLTVNTFFFFAMLGTRPIMPIYAAELGVSSTIIGMLVSTTSFLPMLIAVRAGKWVDRFGAKKGAITGGAGVFAALLIPALIPKIELLFFSQTLFGFFQLLMILSMQKTIGNLPGNRDKLITAHSMSAAAGDMLGPLVTGFTYAHYGFSATYFIAASSALLGLTLILLVRSEHWRASGPRTTKTYPYQGSTWTLLRNVNLRKAILIGGIGLYSKELIVAYFPLYATSIGMSASRIGMMLSLSAFMAILVRFVQFPLVLRFGRTTIMTTALAISATLYLALGLTDSAVALALIIATLGASLGIGQPLSMVYTLNHTPSQRHGEVLGMRVSINRTLQFCAPIVFGGVAGVLGLTSIFFSNAALMIAGVYFTRIRAGQEALPDSGATSEAQTSSADADSSRRRSDEQTATGGRASL
ncbi:MFS transporter [Paenibacillus sp. IB182496]|uniref:MFS transporter n=1 Tax=Paenibacillus sabuli TaxID=2772509 RepID=A0A927BVD3_9BACL|nr:MFS transporter [Paenibacillus sabuli]MBD2847042.1 MFS transporter [Paenibacillus sabuli]